MLNRRIVLSAVLIMGMAAAAFATSGWSYTGPERTMYLMFSKPVALPGATLAAGELPLSAFWNAAKASCFLPALKSATPRVVCASVTSTICASPAR